jgi:hypothetical protein
MILAATSGKKGSHHRLGDRNVALFFYWQGIQVAATLTFEKTSILGRVAAIFIELMVPVYIDPQPSYLTSAPAIRIFTFE